MLTFVIMVGAVMLPILIGGLVALFSSRLDTVVTETKEEVENKDKGYNQAVTIGHKIKFQAEPEEQIRQARLLGAKKAASIPRGANMRIGRLGQSTLKTAGQAASLQEDAWTSAKIAKYHGWDGARLGFPTAEQLQAAPTAVASAPAASGKIALVPGRDYEYTPLTDDMDPAEKRKTRIANAKAKSKAVKAAKSAQTGSVAPVAAAPAAAAAAAPAAAAPVAAPMATGIPEPEYIEITDDMPPDEVRKARIQNSKARSAYNKALKAAGVDPSAVEAVPAAAPAAAAAPVQAAPAPTAAGPDPAALANIPKPDYIEITDSLSSDEVRQARIANSKARSAYNKALKAAGIDPKSVSE
jgi:hypothetical protein